MNSMIACQSAELPWSGARQLPQPEDGRHLFEYELPAGLAQTFNRALLREGGMGEPDHRIHCEDWGKPTAKMDSAASKYGQHHIC
mmetsp:Transcript_78774/g.139199  ORF Transcript_78774/g.139199 Transcript_78774/m.139199 type:complete len:85 (-) Transcript_78774:5-259(-)